MYCWHLLLLAVLYLTPPSTSDRFNGRQCCDRVYQDFSDARLLSYRSLRDKLTDDRDLIRAPDIRTSRWKDTRDIVTAYRRIYEEMAHSKSGERHTRNNQERRITERVADHFNNENIYRFDTRNKNYVRRDVTRNTFQRNDSHRPPTFRRMLDSTNRQMRGISERFSTASRDSRKQIPGSFRNFDDSTAYVERNPVNLHRNIEALTSRENTVRQVRIRFDSLQDNRNELRRSREFEDNDAHRRLNTNRRKNNIRNTSLQSVKEIGAGRRFGENTRARLQIEERMPRVSRMSRVTIDRRHTGFISERRSSFDLVVTRRFSQSPMLTRKRITVSNIKDARERQILGSSVKAENRDTQSDRHLSYFRTELRTMKYQKQHRFSTKRDNSRRSTEPVSSRISMENSLQSENLSRPTRELRRNNLNLNRRFARSIPRHHDTQTDIERRLQRSQTRQFEIERRLANQVFRPSQERDITRNGRIHREHHIIERQTILRGIDQRFLRTPSESLEARRAKLERYVSHRRNIATIEASNSRRDLSSRGRSTERRLSVIKRDNMEYSTDRHFTRHSVEHQDTRSTHLSRTPTDKAKFDTNIRISRAASDIGIIRKSVERRPMSSRMESADTLLEGELFSWTTTERNSRQYTPDNRLDRTETVSRISVNRLNSQRHNRQILLSMDRVDIRSTRDRQDSQLRINLRRSLERGEFPLSVECFETRRYQGDQRSRMRSRTVSDLEARVSRRIENADVRFRESQLSRMTRRTQEARHIIEQNMDSRVPREYSQVRRSLHRDISYTTEKHHIVRHNTDTNLSRDRGPRQNERHMTELRRFGNQNLLVPTERTVRRNIEWKLTQRTAERDASGFNKRRNVKSILTSYGTERFENRQIDNDEQRFGRDESRRCDERRFGLDLRQDYRMSDITQRARVVPKMSEQIRKRTENPRSIKRISERNIEDSKFARMSETTADRTDSNLSNVRKLSERVKESTENRLNFIRQDSRTSVLRQRVERHLSHAIRFDLHRTDLESIKRQVTRSHRTEKDSRSKLEHQPNHDIVMDYSDQRDREAGSYILSWQHLFYTIQGLYLCSVILQVHANDQNSKMKARNFAWWKPSYRMKLD